MLDTLTLGLGSVRIQTEDYLQKVGKGYSVLGKIQKSKTLLDDHPHQRILVTVNKKFNFDSILEFISNTVIGRKYASK